jgi:dienelactone hydrolase
MAVAIRWTPPCVAQSKASFVAQGIHTGWDERADALRKAMAEILTLPSDRCELAAETHRTVVGDGYVIECVSFASEPNSRVTASLYLPGGTTAQGNARVPGILVACGHGGSKSAISYQYAGQLYAKLGFACLILDTIGEEERHAEGKMGTRAHDMYHFRTSEERREFVRTKLKRMVLGKIVWDLMRGLDYLEARTEVDSRRLGIMGNSLGGCSAGAVALLDPRVKAAVISGWGFIQPLSVRGKDCTSMPYEAFARTMSFDEMTALLAPHSTTLFLNGTNDTIIDPDENGAALVRHVRAGISGAEQILQDAGVEGVITSHFVPDACHRAHLITHPAAAWMQQHLMPPAERRAIPAAIVKLGDWVDAWGQQLEKLYDTEARQRGTPAIDIGAAYREPNALACFPDGEKPAPEYTWQGWVTSTIGSDAAPK